MAYVSDRYAQHFRGTQGFGIDTLRARQAWFTPCLYSLLLADAAGAEARGEIGYVDWDPFTSAQDDASGFRVTGAVRVHDTVQVHVGVLFGSATPAQALPVTIAVTRDTVWRIADIAAPDIHLARALDSVLHEQATHEHREYRPCVNRPA